MDGVVRAPARRRERLVSEEVVVARSIWSGFVSFGLVNILVKVYSAVHPHDVWLHQLAPDGSRIHCHRVSEKTGRTVD